MSIKGKRKENTKKIEPNLHFVQVIGRTQIDSIGRIWQFDIDAYNEIPKENT